LSKKPPRLDNIQVTPAEDGLEATISLKTRDGKEFTFTTNSDGLNLVLAMMKTAAIKLAEKREPNRARSFDQDAELVVRYELGVGPYEQMAMILQGPTGIRYAIRFPDDIAMKLTREFPIVLAQLDAQRANRKN
jgi:hypothetical protein